MRAFWGALCPITRRCSRLKRSVQRNVLRDLPMQLLKPRYGETHARPAQSWQLFPVFTIITDTSSFLQHAYLTCAFQALCTCGKSVCIKGSLQTPRGRASCMEAWGRSGPIWRGNGSLRAMAM